MIIELTECSLEKVPNYSKAVMRNNKAHFSDTLNFAGFFLFLSTWRAILFFVAKSRIPNPSPQLPLGKLYKHNSKQHRHNLPSVSQFQSFKTHQSVIFFVLQKHRYGNLLFQNFEMFGRVAINSFFVLAPEQTSRQFIYSTLPLSLPLPPPDRLFCNSRASNSAN